MAGPKLQPKQSYVDQLCAPYYKKRPGVKFNHLNFSQTKQAFLQNLSNEEKVQQSRISSIKKAIKDFSTEGMVLSKAIETNKHLFNPLKDRLGRTPSVSEAKNFLQGELRRYQYRISMIERTRSLLIDFAHIPEKQLAVVLQNAIALWEAIVANIRNEGENKYRRRVRGAKDKLDKYNEYLLKIQSQLGKNDNEFKKLRTEIQQKREEITEAWTRLRQKIADFNKKTNSISRGWRRLRGTNYKEQKLIKEKKDLVARTQDFKAKESRINAKLQKVLGDPKIQQTLKNLRQKIETDPSVKDYCQWRQAGHNLSKVEHQLVETRRTQINDMLNHNDPAALNNVVSTLNENYKLSLSQIFAAKNKEQRDVIIEQKLGRHLALLHNVQNGNYRKELMKKFESTVQTVQSRLKHQNILRKGAVYLTEQLANEFSKDKDNPLSKVAAVSLRALKFVLKNRPLRKDSIDHIRNHINQIFLGIEKQIDPKVLNGLDQTKTELKKEKANTLSTDKIKHYQNKLAAYPSLSLWLSQKIFNQSAQMLRNIYTSLHGADSDMLHPDSKLWLTLAQGIDSALDGIPGLSSLTKKLGARVNGLHLGRWTMLQLHPWGFTIKNKNGREVRIPAAEWMNGPTTITKRIQQVKTALAIETAARVGARLSLIGAKATIQILRYGAALRFMPGVNSLTVKALQKLAILSNKISILPKGTINALRIVGSGSKQAISYAGKKLTGKAAEKLAGRATLGALGGVLILGDIITIGVETLEARSRSKQILAALQKYKKLQNPTDQDKKELRSIVLRHLAFKHKGIYGSLPLEAFGHDKLLSIIPYETQAGRVSQYNLGMQILKETIEQPGDPTARIQRFTEAMKKMYPQNWQQKVQTRLAQEKNMNQWILTGKGTPPRFASFSGLSTINNGVYLRILMEANFVLGSIGVQGFPLNGVLKSMKIHVIDKNQSYQQQLKKYQQLREHTELLIRNQKHTHVDLENLMRQAKKIGYSHLATKWLKRQGISENETITLEIESSGKINKDLRKARQIKENRETKSFSAYGLETKINKKFLSGWQIQGLDFNFSTKALAKRAWITAAFQIQNLKKYKLEDNKPFKLNSNNEVEIKRASSFSLRFWSPKEMMRSNLGYNSVTLSQAALYQLGLTEKKDCQKFIDFLNNLYQRQK